jgi:hypothetical protein
MAARKKKELTDKQVAFLEALFGEADGDFREAMRIAGYEHLNTADITKSLHEEIIEWTQYYLAATAPKAAMKTSKILDDPTAPGNKELRETAKEIWDRVGPIKAEKQQVESDSGAHGIFILPPKKESDDS